MYLQKLFPFRLITFDVTNTLINFQASIGKTYGDVGLRHGVKCDPSELTKNFRREFKKMIKNHPNFGRATGLSWQKWWNIVVCETFKKCQSDLNQSKLDSICSELIDLYCTSYCWTPASGSVELLNYLKHRGVSLGVISNTDPRLHEILKNLKLDFYFDFVLTSYETGFSKPDRRIFEEAMTKSDLLNLYNHQCLHIGDNLDLDYTGAKNSGWNSFLVLRRKQQNDNSPINGHNPHSFEDLVCLHQYLELKWDKYEVQ